MAQRISGLYRIVTLPSVYKAIGFLLRDESARRRFIADVVRPAPGMTVLDCGCGPARMLPYLAHVDYTGIDLNPRHIAYARDHYRGQGRFIVADAAENISGLGGGFDIILVSALLHHLGDDEARRLLTSLAELTKPGGRIVTLDSIWLPRQNPIVWMLNKLDSGQNVRTAEGYLSLADGLRVKVESRIYRDLLSIPYDHFSMTLTKLEQAPTALRRQGGG